MIDVEAYLIVSPEFDSTGTPVAASVRSRQKDPILEGAKVPAGSVVLRLGLAVPDGIFEAVPAQGDVPEDARTVEITVEDHLGPIDLPPEAVPESEIDG